uniref:Uncharacterized protein n=1 Tax=Tanacetum cinerariifolium TaxID=118510 RepID=A0A699KBX4_TANCI|nr:hypothetical protein [Tanacetum cinerariifolium]
MMISFCSLKKSVFNITNSSTNKAFKVPIDPSRLQSPFNSHDELFAPCHILLSPKTRIHTQIKLLDLEFLDSVGQCFQNLGQRVVIELVDLVESHNISFIVVDREHDCSRRLNDDFFSTRRRIMSVNIELLSIKPPVRDAILCTYVIVNRICEQLVTLLHLELKYQFKKFVISPVFTSSEFSARVTYVEANAVAQLFSTSDTLEEGMMEEEMGAIEKILMLMEYLEHQMHPLEEVAVAENFLHINGRQITKTSLKWSLHLPVYCIGGGGGIVVVVMTVEVVADEVGSREPDCEFVRSITRVVNERTEEVS